MNTLINIPNFIYPLLLLFGLSFSLFFTISKNGEKYYNRPVPSILMGLLNTVILFNAGFLDTFNIPQIIWFCLFSGGIALVIFDKKEQTHSFFSSFFATLIVAFLYWWGGAFKYLTY